MQRTDESDDMVPSEKGAQLRKEALRWVIRLHVDGISPEDRRAFDAWHAQSAAHAHMFRTVFTVWDSAELRAAAAAAAKSGCLHSTQRRCCVVDVRPGHGVHGLVRNRREYFDTAMHWRVIIDPDPRIAHS